MKKRLHTIFTLFLFVSQAMAQGSFKPREIDYPTSHPYLLFKKDELNTLRQKWHSADSTSETLSYIKSQIERYSKARTYLKHWDGLILYKKSCANAVYATSAAFRYAMDSTAVHPITGQNLADWACETLTLTGDSRCVLQYPGLTWDHPGEGEGEKPHDFRDQKQLDGGFGLMHYCYIYDILKGTGYFDDKVETEKTIRKLILDYARDYFIHISKHGPFVGWWDKSNHRIIAVAALGVAALTLNEHESTSILEQPRHWISYTMHHFYDNLDTLSVPEGGYAEGPYYISYVFNGVIPFAWSHFLFTNGKPVLYDAVDDLPYKYHNARIYNTPFYHFHPKGGNAPLLKTMGKFMINLRLPDGSKPNFDDGDYGTFWSPVLASTYRSHPEAPVFNWDFDTMTASCKDDVWWGDWELLFVTYDPTVGCEPPNSTNWGELNQIMPVTGKAVMRTGWGPDATYFAINAANGKMNSTNHQQADNTTFILTRGLDPLIIDSGHYRWPVKYNFNKASNHNRFLPSGIDIPYTECEDQNEHIYDPDAFISHYQSDGRLDFLKAWSPVDYEHKENPFDFYFDVQRTVIFDREAVEPYIILVDQAHNHDIDRDYIWRLHGHCDKDTLAGNTVCEAENYTCTWKNIGFGDEQSQIEAYINTTDPIRKFNVVSDKYMHSYDAFHAFYYHDCLELEMTIPKEHFQKVFAILQPSPNEQDILQVDNLAVIEGSTGGRAIRYANTDTLGRTFQNLLYINNEVEQSATFMDPLVTDQQFCLKAGIFFVKLNAQSQITAMVAEDLSSLVVNNLQFFTCSPKVRTILLRYHPDSIEGTLAFGQKLDSIQIGLWVPNHISRYSHGGEFKQITVPLHWNTKWQKSVGTFTILTPTELQTADDHPAKFELSPGYPNPFNANIRFTYQVDKAGIAEVSIYNIKGQRVTQLVKSVHLPNRSYQVIWDGKDRHGNSTPSGAYFCRLSTANNRIKTAKVLRIN